MRRFAIVFIALFFSLGSTAHAEPQWLTLPPTPTLPDGGQIGLAPVNGIKLWYGEFGHGAPVIRHGTYRATRERLRPASPSGRAPDHHRSCLGDAVGDAPS